jgi:hypothetical protein
MPTAYIFGAIAVLLLVGFAIWRSAERGRKIRAWASERGLSFRSGPERRFDARYPAFDCLRRGRDRYASMICEGDWSGRRVTTFDYRYVTGSGKNRKTHEFSAIVLQGSLPLKPLWIRPENVFDRLSEVFGLDDIDFESAEFSREFHVASPDMRWAYDVLHQRTMEFLLPAPRFSVQFDGRDAIAWRSRRFSPELFASAIGVVEGILDRLPEYVVRNQTQGKGST